jgi:hypothetical protein
MRSAYKIFCFVLLGILLCTTVVSASDSFQAKNVLIIFSLEPGLPAYDLIHTNHRATLDSQANEPINIIRLSYQREIYH